MSDFEGFCHSLKSRLENSAAAPDAEGHYKRAAVALILREHAGEPEMLIIKRATLAGDHWSGHLALPGGRRQLEDRDLWHTAMRETQEEVGIDLSAGGRLLGELETITPRSPLAPQIVVSPFLAVAPARYHQPHAGTEAAPLTLNHEVAVAFWVTVTLLKSAGTSAVFRWMVEDRELSWPAYQTEHGLIWGLTERILSNFLKLLE